MKAVLVFDSLNDLLFSKWDDTFIERIKLFDNEQEGENNLCDGYNVAQLLSPIITSQRVMASQFGNSYTSMQCKDNTNIVFDDILDHVLMIISEDDIDDVHREILDCKALIQHICGQNINLLHKPVYQEWLSALIDSRTKGDTIPGASGVFGESGATAAALNALKAAAKDVKCNNYQHYHLLLFVGDKLLALYSSRGSEDLLPPDLILLSIQAVAAQEYWKDVEDVESVRLPWLSEQNSAIVNMVASGAPAAPHALRLAPVASRLTLATLVDLELREVGVATYLTSQVLSNLRRLLLQRNLEMLPNTLDSLEAALKKTTDALRKNKANATLCARLSAKMLELRKSCSTTKPLTPETAAAGLHSALELVIEQLKPDIPSIKLDKPLKDLTSILAPYVDFLQVKALRCFGLGSYVEEFPGLIHFVYVDRGTGRYLAPDAADCADMVSREMISRIVSRCLSVWQGGYSGAAWRAGALHACGVRWFTRRGAPAAPTARQARQAPPADLMGTFYKQLIEQSFPNDSSGVSVKELICIHLGLVPASTAVQQARRLAHSVQELSAGDLCDAAQLL